MTENTQELEEQFDENVRSATTSIHCPSCRMYINVGCKTDYSSNIKKFFGKCGNCQQSIEQYVSIES